MVRVGNQVPRIEHLPKGAVDFADGDEACSMGEHYGLAPDEWQERHIRYALARGRSGNLSAGIVGQSVARQNGKNGELELIELHKMVFQGRRILHTAHEVKTARKAFRRLCSFFQNPRHYPELARLVLSIRATNGQEAIYLHRPDCETFAVGCVCVEANCPSCEFSARSRGAARGFTVDDLVCDEAQELTDEQLAALLPTVSAAPSGDPQQLYYGTPPSLLMLGEVFRRIRADGVTGKNSRLFWQEWSIADEFDPHDAVKSWQRLAFETNPALGVRIGVSGVRDDRS